MLTTYQRTQALLEPDQAQSVAGAARSSSETVHRTVGGRWDIELKHGKNGEGMMMFATQMRGARTQGPRSRQQTVPTRTPQQRSSASPGLPRFVQRSASSHVPVQRDEPSTLPPVPSYRLTPPSILQPPRLLSQQYQLSLGSDTPAWLEQLLTPAQIANRLTGQLSLTADSAGQSAASTLRPEGPEQGPGVTVPPAPTTAPSFAPTPPLVPNVPPSPGTGIYLSMAMSHPAVNLAVLGLKRQALSSWRELGTGTQVGLISSTAVVALGSLGVMMSDPRYRAQGLALLERSFNGQIIGIPRTPLSVEVNIQGANMLFGFHLDLGSVLPPRFGFGPASPVGPHPMSAPMPPLQRAADSAAMPADAALGQRIHSASGGHPLDAATHSHLERSLDVALPAVQLHTDAEADQLARAVSARAFTSGTHVFFRADAHPDTASDGMRLLAHEALHTAQQTAGPVAGTPTFGGVTLSDPGDRFEREAADKATHVGPTRISRRE